MISCKASPLIVALVLLHMLFFSWVANASIPEESTTSVTKGRGLLPAATLHQYRVKRIEMNDAPPPWAIGWHGGPIKNPRLPRDAPPPRAANKSPRLPRDAPPPPPPRLPIGSRGGPIKSPRVPRRPPPSRL